MLRLFPLIDVLGQAWHGTWWGFKARAAARYRPEQHYMRGPGPKWRAKTQADR